MRKLILLLLLAVASCTASVIQIGFNYTGLTNPQNSGGGGGFSGTSGPNYSLLFQLSSITDGTTSLSVSGSPIILNDVEFLTEVTWSIGMVPALVFNIVANYLVDPNILLIPDRLSVFLLDDNLDIYSSTDIFGDTVGPIFTVDFDSINDPYIETYFIDGQAPTVSFQPSSGTEVPEPSALLMVGAGLGLLWTRRRKR